ncbi:ABC transporter permease [Thermoclostridium caenicola]|uniref:Oligopeptide transport system permease protein n=1 Tax=Thermoclostridium caenicola TaxID=659425 RepID=A0A1M6DW89_9FIRM|nr:ABC transporter permease [Thermoclostridium caenicola]SHI77399.1 oligopeptide transport system permease protein [Thermoclostridium caenicola]
MGRYIVKRVFLAVVTIWLVATITFFLMFMIPGGPFLAEKSPSPATLEALNRKYGLDQPVIVQYKNYMLNLLKGELGESIKQRGRTVGDIISRGFKVSARVGGISILVSVLIGVPLGCVAALNRGKWLDNLIMVVATFGIAVPSFVISTVLMLIFSIKLDLLPTYGLTSWQHYIMPVIALSFYPTAYISRLMRTSMLDVLGQDYMRTAKAKGLSQFKMLFKHALRNAILPVVTYLGPLIAYTLTGSFVVEKIFTIPGLGNEFISSITGRDYTMIMGTTIFLASLVIIMNLVVDIAYKIIDPRIKLK